MSVCLSVYLLVLFRLFIKGTNNTMMALVLRVGVRDERLLIIIVLK